MTYNRESVKAYAEKWWWRPCADGIVWTKTGHIDVAKTMEDQKHKLKLTGRYEAIFLNYSTEGLEGLFMLPAGLSLQAKDSTFEEWRDRGAIMLCSFKDNPNEDRMPITFALHPPYYGLNDCTHFTTECLIAGGFPAPNEHARRGAPDLYTHLAYSRNVKLLASEVSMLDAAKVIKAGLMKLGDVIIYTGKAKRDRHHGVIFLDTPTVTMHTSHRYGRPWWMGGGDPEMFPQLYSLFHIDNDEYQSWEKARWVGWWQVTEQGVDRYMYLDATGHVLRSNAPPKSAGLKPHGGTDYWFADLQTMTTCVRKTGALETFTMSPLSPPVTATGVGSNGFPLPAFKL